MPSKLTAPALRGLICLLCCASAVAAEPYRPTTDDTVVLELSDPGSETEWQLQDWPVEKQLNQIRRWLDKSAREGDRRSLALAEQALRRLRPEHPGTGVMLAIALQRRHAFDEALQTLQSTRQAEVTDDPNLFIQQASLLRLRGDFNAAHAACEALRDLGRPQLQSLCQLPIESLQGNLASSRRQLEALPVEGAPTLRAWRDSELAVLLERQGEPHLARQLWLTRLASHPDDHYARGQLAWNLWRAGRHQAMLNLLPSDSPHLNLQLLYLMASRATGQTGWQAAAGEMQRRLLRAQRIHAEDHNRELAWLRLELLDEPAGALQAALLNWRNQRSPDDLLLLAAVARKTGDPQCHALLLGFLQKHGYQDARLPELRPTRRLKL